MRTVKLRYRWTTPLWVVVLSAGCGQWGGVETGSDPDPTVTGQRIFDAHATYRDMGLLVSGDPLPFVASHGFVAGPTPDSTFAVFGLSLANSALVFRKTEDHYEARYRVEAVFHQNGTSVGHISEEAAVRVAEFPETQRFDESVIFQHVVALPPGELSVDVVVRDRQSRSSGHAAGAMTVPRYGSDPAVSSLFPVYRSSPRTRRSEIPQLVLNPRATMPFLSDTLYLYVEAYGLAGPATVVVRVRDPGQHVVWRGERELERRAGLGVAEVAIAPEALRVGKMVVEADMGATRVTARAGVLVSFSERWVVDDFGEVLSFLRYFGQDDAIRGLRDASADERPRLWREFWERTDPNPNTPKHEAIDEYFKRLSQANELFGESRTPGWLTDRGEVMITLGAPNEIHDASADVESRQGLRVIRWNYLRERLTVDFIDDTGFGNFRLTPTSRSEYLRVLHRMRQSE